jgi:hypothetical protein
MKTKICTGCKQPLSIKMFSNDKNRAGGKCYYCKMCYGANERRQRAAYADRRTHLVLMRTFGISLEKFQEMSRAQKDVCAICFKKDPEEGKRLSVDHCHITGKIRGLLCNPCNKMLGGALDSPSTLARGISYLEAASVRL